jgi:hypothetical protein
VVPKSNNASYGALDWLELKRKSFFRSCIGIYSSSRFAGIFRSKALNFLLGFTWIGSLFKYSVKLVVKGQPCRIHILARGFIMRRNQATPEALG